ncbi:hypothetical protein TTHERM_00289260 (macronuclear) [Tetrahymena thermophila SB210]|uniref:Uncharacterized protein n=1 Tax=Tetrahymena thermophila (strain SB210) TaxID=312017 RepID=I7M234_TETTS|nr:hypothetical protein TTHERM_00289260 [Tetrahymena thermophila SB210]EAR98398.1 hypothetical protein TTHERM_00289260 [Tetrahymena thermophila SB210]|eukprot:XP_001018643.1 hypothetical protein TTHERM_00289260 [Tetrahymena thermophila SB210]
MSQSYDPKQIRQKLHAVMKSTNPVLKLSDEEKELYNLKQQLEDHKANLQEAVTFMKKVLQTEIFDHLRFKHGIYEKADAEWYYSSQDYWAKQYCVFSWDEEKKALPKYWCDSGCQVCNDLYQKYKSTMDIADEHRIKSIKGVDDLNKDLNRYAFEQRMKQQQNNMNNQNFINKPNFFNNIFSQKK